MSATIETVAVDYFTVTEKLSRSKDLYDQVREINKTLDLTFKQRQWKFFGYDGFIYRGPNGKGHFAYGEASTEIMGTIVQASGYFAQRYVEEFLCCDARWARVDLCVDCQLEVPAPNLAMDYYTWAKENGGGKRTYSIIQNTMQGSTLYVGSRSSYDFGRVYDKGMEISRENEPGKVWRYEIELKQERAKAAVNSLMSYHSRNQNTSHAIAVTVYDWFDRRNVPPVFKRKDSEGLNLSVKLETPHETQKLLWLRKQVSPTVRELLSDNKREVLDALGITEFYRLRRK